jgi:hypothetical protein
MAYPEVAAFESIGNVAFKHPADYRAVDTSTSDNVLKGMDLKEVT